MDLGIPGEIFLIKYTKWTFENQIKIKRSISTFDIKAFILVKLLHISSADLYNESLQTITNIVINNLRNNYEH